MANPPFNVDLVNAERIKGDPRLPFGLPGVNKQKKVSNGNYLWISYFWSYLNEKGRAGFVMSSQASSAGHGEKEVRRKFAQPVLIEINDPSKTRAARGLRRPSLGCRNRRPSKLNFAVHANFPRWLDEPSRQNRMHQ